MLELNNLKEKGGVYKFIGKSLSNSLYGRFAIKDSKEFCCVVNNLYYDSVFKNEYITASFKAHSSKLDFLHQPDFSVLSVCSEKKSI